MHASPRFARLGKGICYATIAMFAFFLLFSVTAPQAAASPDENWVTPSAASASSEAGFLENFEDISDWVYEEVDTNSRIDAAVVDAAWKTEGSKSAKIMNYNDTGVPAVNDYGQIKKSIDLTNIDKIVFDIRHINADEQTRTSCYIDGNEEWFKQEDASGGKTYTDQEVDVSGYSGSHDVIFRCKIIEAGAASGYGAWVDYLRGDLIAGDTKDENTATEWRPEPADESGAWCRWDTGALKFCAGCRVYWGADAAYRPTAYRVQISENTTDWTTVVTEAEAAPASAWKEYSWSGQYCRYIKLVVDTHGSSGTEIYEMDWNGGDEPNPPTGLLCNGQTNPIRIVTPIFSAICTDNDDGDNLTYYAIQVDNDSNFESTLWDSGKTDITDFVEGSRSSEITYGGPALDNGATYYWRVKFWDYNEGEGLWSTESASFEMDWVPIIESITVDNSLIDRDLDYSGSGAEVDTTITIRVQDNDGNGEISGVHVSIRDKNDGVVVDNIQVTDNTVVDENTLDFAYSFDCLDNLPNDNLGAFDVDVLVEDTWGGNDTNAWGGDGASLFTVNDRYSSISFDPASPHAGWKLAVSGTHSRYVGSSSVTGSWLIDNCHGQFNLGASDSYDYSYTISNASPGDNVSVTIRSVDGTLDGVSSSSYVVNENVKFQVWVRFEENYALAEWIPDENRPIDLLFEWDGGTYPYTLTANPENIIAPEAGTSMKIVKLTDNDDYWRFFIPPYPGGNLNFIIVDDISDVEQYRFYLQDYTAQYSPPDGQIIFKFWIGENLAEINSDYWGADWRSTAWLVTGTQYQVWVRGLSAPLRLVGPIDAVNPTDEKTILVQMAIENMIPIFDYVYWTAWRESDNIIRVEYRDNLDNTITANVSIFDAVGVKQIEYQPDNEWFITTWISADGAMSYNIVLTVQHGEYGNFTMEMPIGTLGGPPGVGGGVSEPWGLPSGLTLSSLASVILVVVVGLSFDALRVQMGMLAMALTTIFCWQMGLLPLPGPHDGIYTATLILVMAVLFALTWRRGK